MSFSISPGPAWIGCILAAAVVCTGADSPADQPMNALANEKSPYLLQHAHNPVDWYPWGAEAFEKARRENKPIFLSVGYSTCHWCHVMAHESFRESEEIAKLMNEHFVNIKVDREERPDVDRVYMTYVQATTGGGGWPMSVFLTPGPEAVFRRHLLSAGGSLRAARVSRPCCSASPRRGKRIARTSSTSGNEVAIEQLREYAGASAPTDDAAGQGGDRRPRSNQLDAHVRRRTGRLRRRAEISAARRAEFSLPRLRAARAPSRAMARRRSGWRCVTLRKMAAGGMHDHLGGGFHRYSVDRFWHIPHFEKMLYDQAQLAVSYLDAFQITRDAAVRQDRARHPRLRAARHDRSKTAVFTPPKMPTRSSSTASRSTREGAFYVWTKAEIDAAAGRRGGRDLQSLLRRGGGRQRARGQRSARRVQRQEHAHPAACRSRRRRSCSSKRTRKSRRRSPSAAQKLLELRAKRPRPHLDDKIITAWNGLMISAFARAAQVLDDPDYLAVRAALGEVHPRAPLERRRAASAATAQGASDVAGFADDYASLIQGLLDLYEADFDMAWLQWAVELQTKQDALFCDAEHGGYFSVAKAGAEHPAADEGGLRRRRAVAEFRRRAEPAAPRADHRDAASCSERAMKTIGAFAEQLTSAPDRDAADALRARCVARQAAPDRHRRRTRRRRRRARFCAKCTRIFSRTNCSSSPTAAAGQQWLGERLEFLKTVGPIDGKPAAYVCENFVCQLPTTDPAKLREQLIAQPTAKP